MNTSEIQAKIEKLKKNKFIPEALKAKQIAKLEEQLNSSSKKTDLSDRAKWEASITKLLVTRLDIPNGDAQGMVEAQEAEIQNAWIKEMSPTKTVNAIFFKNDKPKNKETATYKGTPVGELNEENCRELLAQVKERAEKQKKSEKKSKSRPIIEKVVSPIIKAVKKVIDNVPVEEIKEDPDGMIDKMKAIETATKEYLMKMKGILGEDWDKDEVEDGIKEIRAMIKELDKKYN